MIITHAFGYTSGIKRATLSGTFTPPTTGMYTLKIENTRGVASSTCIYNYIDNIRLEPETWSFEADTKNIDCNTGGNVVFDLNAPSAYAGMDYWVWMSVSGTYPGTDLSGINIPLNWDVLLEFGLYNPNFPGTVGFIGQLGMDATAQASIFMIQDRPMMLLGIPFNFAYVVTSPGPSMPVLYASNPVLVKYIP